MSDHDQNGEILAERLRLIPGYRVLRELDITAGIDRLPTPTTGESIAAVLDFETTGLDPDRDRPIEFALQRFIFDGSGNIKLVEMVRSWREDPGIQMSARLTQLTGLSNAELVGHRFSDREIAELLGGAALVIAHNAAFDRPFFDSRFPTLAHKAWACSLTQVDWLSLGFDGRSLGHLLMQAGWYFEGHRAANDVAALTKLLSLKGEDETTIFSKLLETSAATTVCIDAVGAPFELKDALKEAGYRWRPTQRVWSLETDEAVTGDAIAWLEKNVYRGAGRARLRRITSKERFARER